MSKKETQPNNKISGNIETKNYSLSQKRQDRLKEIDKELARIKGINSPEDIKEIAKKRKEEFEKIRENFGPLSQESEDEIYKKTVEQVIDSAHKDNENIDKLNLEKNNLANFEAAEDFISYVENLGLEIKPETRGKLLDLLTSTHLIDFEREQLNELAGLKLASKEVIKKITTDELVFTKFNNVLRRQLASTEYRQLLLSKDIELADSKKHQDQFNDLNIEELNDKEITSLGSEEIKAVIRTVLNDGECDVVQGMFWNVLISKNSPYVLKAQRIKDKDDEKEYQERSLFYYPIIRNILGKKFLPRQVILDSKANGRLYALQEKQDLSKMVCLRTGNIEPFLKGEYAPELLESLTDEDNKIELKEFIAGAERLYSEHKLTIDVLGDNLFFQLKDGKLAIKLVDYGCYEDAFIDGSEKLTREMKESLKFFDKLKQLVS